MTPGFAARLRETVREYYDVFYKLSEKDVLYVTEDEAVAANKYIQAEFSGIHHVRDRNLLGSALNSIANHKAYRPDASLAELASILFVRIIKDHPFTDGNKRTAIACMIEFLQRNAEPGKFSHEELYTVAYAVADGKMSEGGVSGRFFGENPGNPSRTPPEPGAGR